MKSFGLRNVALIVLIFTYGSDLVCAQGVKRSVRIDGNRTHTYSNSNGVSKTNIEFRGDIEFNDDESDVAKLSPGGFIKFSKRSFGTKRTVIIEADAKGQINREYYEGRQEVAFEPEGRKWLASVLPDIIRTTGIGAEGRVKKFYKKGGIETVLNEISKISSNYIKGIYYDVALSISGLTDKEIVDITTSAGNEITSNYELGQVLLRNQDIFLRSETSIQAMIKATGKIGSNYDKANVYKTALKHELSPSSKKMIIKGVSNISSNYEKSGVLIQLLSQDLSVENVELVLDEVDHISSSYEQSKVLQYMINKQDIKELDMSELLTTVGEIGSDYEKGKVFNSIISKTELTPEQIALIARNSEQISSDYEQAKLLGSLMSKQKLDSKGIDEIIRMTRSLSSSYDQSKILYQVVGMDAFGTDNYPSFIQAVDRVKSTYEQSKILSSFIDHETLSANTFTSLLGVISNISSNYEKAKLLTALAPKLPNDPAIKDKFIKAASSLSDYDYGKVMRAMNIR